MGFEKERLSAHNDLSDFAPIIITCVSASTYDPTTDSYTDVTTTYNSFALIKNYSDDALNKTQNIKVGDKLLIASALDSSKAILPDLTSFNKVSITVNSESWRVIQIKPLQPDGLTILNKIQIRK